MDDRDFKGVWIPKEIWLNPNLTLLDKVVLIEIDSLDNEAHCVAGNDYLAEFCGCSESKVSRAVSKLIEMGYISVVSFNGRLRVLKSNLSKADLQKEQGSLAKKARQTCKKSKAASQKEQANNIYNNITNNKVNNIKDIGKGFASDKDNYFPQDEALNNAFQEFIKMRKVNKKPLTQHAADLAAKHLIELAGGDNDMAILICNKSIRKTWLDFYPYKDEDNKPDNKKGKGSGMSQAEKLMRAAMELENEQHRNG